jgi:hypothetical protein
VLALLRRRATSAHAPLHLSTWFWPQCVPKAAAAEVHNRSGSVASYEVGHRLQEYVKNGSLRVGTTCTSPSFLVKTSDDSSRCKFCTKRGVRVALAEVTEIQERELALLSGISTCKRPEGMSTTSATANAVTLDHVPHETRYKAVH